MPDQTDRLRRMMDVFLAATRLDEDERAGFVVEVDQQDEQLGADLRRLLDAEQTSGTDGFLEPGSLHLGALLPADGLDAELGRTIGPYQLLGRLGSGGMGTVYEAVRRDDYEQIVAVKLVKRGMDTEEVLRRFTYERQTLAALNHPNIARLLDGGTDDDLPYFVMEYVKGQRIDEYCNRHKLTLRERLELMLPVCDAVAHAHDHIVVHRDIKPANILVTEDGVPKLLDFGLAKMLSSELGFAPSDMTRPEQRFVTLSYASPEQLLGDSVGKPLDVYSLGVVLYELLTGHKPFWLDDLGWDAAMRVVTSRPPFRPSHVVRRTERVRDKDGVIWPLTPRAVATDRSTTPENLHRDLRGDLDNILLTALRKEPHDRYPDARGLAEDLRRYLQDRPVVARPESFSYVVGKFVRRNRIVARGAAALFFVLLIALTSTTWAWLSTVRQREAEVAQKVAEREAETLNRRARSKRLAGHALMGLVGDPELELMLAIEAVEIAPTPIADYALRQALRRTRRGVPPRPYSGAGGPYSFGPGEHRVAAVSVEGGARVWDIGPNRIAAELEPETKVRSVAMGPDAASVVVCGEDGSVRIWEVDTESLRRTLAPPDGIEFTTASITPDGRWVAATDGNLAVVFAVDGDTAGAESVARPVPPRTEAVGPRGTTAVAQPDGTIELIRAGASGPSATLPGHWAAVRWLGFSPDGARLVSASDDTTARIWETGSGRELAVLRPENGPLRWAEFSPDGRWVVTATQLPFVHVWDAATGQQLRWQDGRGAVFTPDSEWLVILTADRDLQVVAWEMFASPEVNLEAARARASRRLSEEEREHYLGDLTPEDHRALLRDLSSGAR